MKGSLLWKLAYIFCALAGVLAGYGVFKLSSSSNIKPDTFTKDSTLVREAGDSVFFGEESMSPAPTISLTATPAPEAKPTPTSVPTEEPTPTEVPVPVEVLPEVTLMPEETVSAGQASVTVQEELPSLGSRWIFGEITRVPQRELQEESGDEKISIENTAPQSPVTETITYPAKIFGQTPIINRSDAYVSYFEFCYDLIAMMEPEIQARGLNMNVLMTKFVLKALFCGIDIEQLNINAPIPRRLAALCLWLAAQVLNENGCATSPQSAGQYVTDISSCSASERKAIAYLYEQGVIKGYQVAGQAFGPEKGLESGEGEEWLDRIKQCWK